jgi:6-carboxyhexanoate--CoA ligase
VVQEYIDRACHHPKGKPDHIVITVEKIIQKPRTLSALPVATLKCASPSQAAASIRKLLYATGISRKAVDAAFCVVRGNKTMRGAALVLASFGRRVEPDRDRGIRASRLGITNKADATLSTSLGRHGLDTQTIKEALILATKVAACRDILAELCVSDDPDYTTGYVASRELGYVRIPHIKEIGSENGGRIFFLTNNADIPAVIRFLEKTPVIINHVPACHGIRPIDELTDRHNK